MIALPVAGAAGAELAPAVHDIWIDAAARAGINLCGFNAAASLPDRLAWAARVGLTIGTVLSRYSMKLQHSTTDQIRDCLQFAAAERTYVPPEYICVDEAVSGRKARRDGLDRVKLILGAKLARTLYVFKVSRLFRVGYRGFQFFQEEVVEEGLRAVSVSQGIDTADEKTWKQLAYLHGMMDDMLLTTIADGVRSGLKGLFLQGFVTSALPVGYQRVEVAGVRPTNLGRPRTIPGILDEVGALIRQHCQWIRDGMAVKEGCRRWVQAGGPCDPRSTTGQMTYPAYRRMLSNPRYTGRWAFGKTKNTWSNKRDYTLHVIQPETEVAVVLVEELRILDDDLFFAVQQRMAGQKLGPRGPRKAKTMQLHDLVTDCFYCARCEVRYQQAGGNGRAMSCRRGDLCPCNSTVSRSEATEAICRELAALLVCDDALVEAIIGRAVQLDAAGDESVRAELARSEKATVTLAHKVEDLTELLGQGSPDDRATLKAKIRAAQAERYGLLSDAARLRQALGATEATLTPERVRAMLEDLGGLLEAGAAGTLGPDVVYRAAAAFRLAVGGRILVQIDRRPGRKRTSARGRFRPGLIATARAELALPAGSTVAEAAEVVVWLRQPPKTDALADRAHQLIDGQGMSFRQAAAALEAEGQTKVNTGVAWQMYHRYYEMLGQPVPVRPFTTGRPRKSVSAPTV